MRAIDAEQMANCEKVAYRNTCKKTTDLVTVTENAIVHYKIQKLIADTPELPTMQSNDICDYCQNKGKCELPFGCIGYFVGKKVIEVE